MGTDPAVLDTLPFAGADIDKVAGYALSSRPDTDWFEHDLAYVRRRVVRTPGNRRSLVILPDGPATIECYDALVEALHSRFDIVLLEIPGFGFSYPRSPEALEFAGTVQSVAAAIHDLYLGPSILVGPCVQGLVALGVANHTPRAISGLIVAQTGDWNNEAAWIRRVLDPDGVLNIPFEGQVALRLAREAAAVDWWIEFAAGPDLDTDTLRSQARRVFHNHGCYALASLVQKWFNHGREPDLATRLPATVLWGLSDASHRETDRRSILRYLPDAKLVEMERVGHFADLEAIEALAEEAGLLLDLALRPGHLRLPASRRS